MVWPVMLPDPEKSWSISCKPSASKKISNCDVPDRLLYAMSYAIRSNFLMTSTSEPCRAKYWALERHLKTWVHAPCTRLGCLDPRFQMPLQRHLKTWVHAPCTRLGCL